jgi:hypothetical protein
MLLLSIARSNTSPRPEGLLCRRVYRSRALTLLLATRVLSQQVTVVPIKSRHLQQNMMLTHRKGSMRANAQLNVVRRNINPRAESMKGCVAVRSQGLCAGRDISDGAMGRRSVRESKLWEYARLHSIKVMSRYH